MTSGQGPRGYRRPDGGQMTILTGISDAHTTPDACYRDGVNLRLCNTRLAVQPQLAGMKTLNPSTAWNRCWLVMNGMTIPSLKG
jgi:4-amino-4-deoxychorismate lyase